MNVYLSLIVLCVCCTNIIDMFCAQVPGLFEGDEFTTLMTQCKEGSQRHGLLLDSSEELYKWFTDQVSEQARAVWEGKGMYEDDWLLQDASLSISMKMVYNRQPY